MSHHDTEQLRTRADQAERLAALRNASLREIAEHAWGLWCQIADLNANGWTARPDRDLDGTLPPLPPAELGDSRAYRPGFARGAPTLTLWFTSPDYLAYAHSGVRGRFYTTDEIRAVITGRPDPAHCPDSTRAFVERNRTMPTLQELHARLFLLRAAEPPAPAVHHYVTDIGPVEAADQIRRGTAPAVVLNELTCPDAVINEDLCAIDKGAARLVTPEDDDWPIVRLTGLAGRGTPLGLWIRGNESLADLTRSAVTITGSRLATECGSTVAADLSHELASRGTTVVSGGSYGIEEAAHRGALAAGGTTAVVLANGVDQTHPHQHARLFESVVDQGGLLVSEYPIGTRPARIRFHARCRLLAAFASATVIVEAGLRSSALTVARAASDLGRRVYGVPGSIHSVASAGVNELLRLRVAEVATSAEHVVVSKANNTRP